MEIRLELRQAFWRVVRDCLIEFHGFGDALAEEKTKVAESEVGDEPIAYSWEPWCYANDLSTALSMKGHIGAYRDLCKFHFDIAKKQIKENASK